MGEMWSSMRATIREKCVLACELQYGRNVDLACELQYGRNVVLACEQQYGRNAS